MSSYKLNFALHVHQSDPKPLFERVCLGRTAILALVTSIYLFTLLNYAV